MLNLLVLVFPNYNYNEYVYFTSRYSDIPLEEIEKVCPACRGTCNCKVCLRGDNMVKVFLADFWRPCFYYTMKFLICCEHCGKIVLFVIVFYELQVRIKEIPILDKLQYLYCLLSSVLPVVKQIHYEQCSEVELEKRLHGKIL